MNGDDLRAWRAAHKLTQLDLAVLLDVRQNTVWRWEAGAVPVPLTVALALETLAARMRATEPGEAVPA